MRRRELKFTRYIFPTFLYTLAIVWCLVMITIAGFAVITSFRKNIDYIGNPGGFPAKGMWTLENFRVIFSKTHLWVGSGVNKHRVFLPEIIYNTLFYSTVNPLFAMVTCASVSYVACRYRNYRFVKGIYVFTIIWTYWPFGASLASTINYLRALGIYDNFYLFPFYNCGAFGFDMLVYYATWQSFSQEYGDAAMIDGASPLRIFLDVYFPLGRGTFLTLFILKFMNMFKTWEVNVTLLPSYPLIGYLGYMLRYTSITEFAELPVQIAGLLIISLPVLIIFMSCRKTFMKSVQFGGLKG